MQSSGDLLVTGQWERGLIGLIEHASSHTVEPRKDLVREGERPASISVILEGWVVRYKLLADGNRQILSLLLPGDVCQANAIVRERMDHALGALNRVRYAEIDCDILEGQIRRSTETFRTVWRTSLVNASIQREWTANIGQRRGIARIAHLLCEIHARLDATSTMRFDGFEFPMTQADIGAATGLTPVHVNRVLQKLRQMGLIRLAQRWLDIVDIDRLRKIAMFDPAYLYLGEVDHS